MSRIPLCEVVAKTVGGGTPDRSNPEFWNGGIPWASVKDFKDGSYRLLSTQEQISVKGLKASASHLIPPGTLIVCTRMAVGRVATADYPVAINQDLRALFVQEAFDPTYILFAVDGIRPQIENLSIGSTVKGISLDQLLGFFVFAPDKPEQAKIAEILSTVDRAIEQTEALIAKQERIKTGLMQDLLTRGIDEHGNLRSESTHQFKDSPLGRIPRSWEVANLGDLADAVDPQPDHRTPAEFPDGVPYIGLSDFRADGSIDFESARKVARSAFAKQQKSFSISAGSFVFGKIGTIGMPKRIPTNPDYALSANVILINPRETPSFVYWWIESQIAKALVDLELHTTSQPAFGIQKMRSFPVPLPTKSERELLGELLNKVELVKTTGMRNLEKLRFLKGALMQDLLTGRKRVTSLLGLEHAH